MITVNYIYLLVLAYLCGSIPFAKIVGLRHGLDIQKHGSGNIGFANTVLVLGWKPGFIVLIGDVSKGLVPALIAFNHASYTQAQIVGLVAILGHVYPVWLKFKGGKGIATGLGVSIVLAPFVALAGLAVYILSFAVFRKSAIGSLIAVWLLPLFSLVIKPEYATFSLALAVIATYTHRSNIRQMLGI